MKEIPPQILYEVKEEPFRDEEAMEHLDKLTEKGAGVMSDALKSLNTERFNRLASFLNREGETMFGFNIFKGSDQEKALFLINEYNSSTDEAQAAETEKKILTMLSV